MNERLVEPRSVTLERREIELIIKSLQKCTPEIDDQERVFNLVEYLKSTIGR